MPPPLYPESPDPAANGMLRWVPRLLLVAGMHSIIAVVGALSVGATS
ncbi:hypothetical protein ACFYO5_22105 [Streptomyces sp. NPDC006259]